MLIVIGRALARWLVSRSAGLREPSLIIGTGHVAQRIATRLASRPDYCLDVAGFIDDDPLDLPEDLPPLLGKTAELEPIVRAYDIERVIVAFSRASSDEHVDLLRRCTELRVRVEVVPRMYEVIGSRTYVHDLGGIPLVSLGPARLTRSGRLIKRSFDLVFASLALVVLAPFFALAAWRIKAGSAGPAFFRQERMGAGGKRFELLKFRTMDANAEERKAKVAHLNKHTEAGPRMFKVADDPRVTTFGRFLRPGRSTSFPSSSTCSAAK